MNRGTRIWLAAGGALLTVGALALVWTNAPGALRPAGTHWAAGASGCSIDGLFRLLKSLESRLGRSMVTSGLIFFRDKNGTVQSVDRERFAALGAEGKISPDTTV